MWGVYADLSSPRQGKWPEKIIGQKTKTRKANEWEGEKKGVCPIDSNPCHVSRGQKTWNFCDNIYRHGRPNHLFLSQTGKKR